MELRQLKYFVKLAETLNFSEAARALYVTQSTLSQQLKQLEQELGEPLFDRNSRSVALTEAGTELLPHARATLLDAKLCIDRITDLKESLCGTLNIGVTYSFGPILTETLVEFMKQFPKVRLNIFYRPMAELMELLTARTVDFALAFRPTHSLPEIKSHILFQNYLAAIVGEFHPLAGHKSVTLAQLAEFDLALPSHGLQARNALEEMLRHNPHDLNIRAELNEVNILLKLIRQNRLATVLAEATVIDEKGIRAIPLEDGGREMTGCVHTLRNSYHKHSMRQFLRMLGESSAVRERVNAWI